MTSVTVAIQGEAGSFSHAAALQALGPDIRLVPCPSFEQLFRAVEAGDAARGAVPIENSLAGSVHENYDLLGAHTLHVVAETQVRVRHCLIARPGTERAAIRRVASHPVALRSAAGSSLHILMSRRSRPTTRPAAYATSWRVESRPTPRSRRPSPPSCTEPWSSSKTSRTTRRTTRDS